MYERELERERVKKKINYYRITLNLTYIYARLREDSRLNVQPITTYYNYKGKQIKIVALQPACRKVIPLKNNTK